MTPFMVNDLAGAVPTKAELTSRVVALQSAEKARMSVSSSTSY